MALSETAQSTTGMAKDNDTRDTDTGNSPATESGESRTTLSSQDYLNSGLLDSRDAHLDKVHDYHLDQDMGETMEQVNSNLHLGSDEDDKTNPLAEDDGGASQTTGTDATQFNQGAAEVPPAAPGTSPSGPGFESTTGVDTALGELSGTDVSETISEPSSGSSRPLADLEGSENGYSINEGNGFSGTDTNAANTAPARLDTNSSNEGDGAPAGPVASNLSGVFDIDAASDSVSETGSIGATTGIQASASVADGAMVTYSLVDDAGGLFSIDPVTGVVSVAGELDAETSGSHTIEVLATASDGATETQEFTITVQDANEFGVSQISDTDATANGFDENAGGGTYTGITVSAEDQDVSDTVTYSVDDPRFVVDENGIVTTADGANFDAESEPDVSLTVTATSSDGSSTSETYNLTIADVNESAVSAVTDTDGAANTISEDATAGASTGITVEATDADATDSVSYAVDDARFEVAADGTVTVAAGASFDAETEGSVDITVTATSSDGSTSTETFTVNVSDVNESAVSAVTDTDGAANTIAEDATAGASTGITVEATDADATDSVSYAVDDARFEVAADGTVTVAAGASFDAETEGSVDITVTATSSDGSTSTETFTVNVSDVNESAVSAVTDTDGAANTISEDATAGASTGITVEATDADATDSVSYAVDDARFEVAADGTVTVAAGASFDAETEGSVDITVTATSSDGSTSTETFTVNVSDVNESAVSAVTDTDGAANTIAEDATAGASTGITVEATDADATDSVSYSVDDARFEVAADGTVTVAAGASFDAETEGSIDITVTATSSDGSDIDRNLHRQCVRCERERCLCRHRYGWRGQHHFRRCNCRCLHWHHG